MDNLSRRLRGERFRKLSSIKLPKRKESFLDISHSQTRTEVSIYREIQ